MKTTGIILIIVGLVMMVFTGFSYVTEKKVLDIGPLEVNKEVEHPVAWTPIVGGIILVAGVVLVVSGRKKVG